MEEYRRKVGTQTISSIRLRRPHISLYVGYIISYALRCDDWTDRPCVLDVQGVEGKHRPGLGVWTYGILFHGRHMNIQSGAGRVPW